MKGRKVWEIGGFIAGAVLIVFGVVALYLGINGYQTVGDELSAKNFVFTKDHLMALLRMARGSYQSGPAAGRAASRPIPSKDGHGNNGRP